ncbi:MAG: DUF4160 domain-containing protein [Elusimicrobia bacterium]|nr:DUF4160 domain-containing protein [Elusimicrobiota bacterium]
MSEWIVELPDDVTADLQASMRTADVADQRQRLPPDSLILIVGRIGQLKVEIFSREHPPPHFRVRVGNQSTNFRISDCRPLNSRSLPRFFREIREWHRVHKQDLIEAWDTRRPTDCPVGPYRE